MWKLKIQYLKLTEFSEMKTFFRAYMAFGSATTEINFCSTIFDQLFKKLNNRMLLKIEKRNSEKEMKNELLKRTC